MNRYSFFLCHEVVSVMIHEGRLSIASVKDPESSKPSHAAGSVDDII